MQPVNKPHFGTIVNQCKPPPPLSPISSPLPSARLHWCSPAGSEPAPRLCRPGAINLRSSMPKPCGFSTPRTRMPRRASRSDIHIWRKPYVCATSTGATVDVDTPSRGVTLGVFICGLVSEGALSHGHCAYMLNSHLPTFDVFATFAFSAVSRSTPRSTPRAQSIPKKTEMTKMTTKVPVSRKIKAHPRITILHQYGEYFHIPIQEYNNKLSYTYAK